MFWFLIGGLTNEPKIMTLNSRIMEANRNVIAFQIIENVKKFYDSNTNRESVFLDLETYFPEYKILEDNWEMIRDEILEVICRKMLQNVVTPQRREMPQNIRHF